jgi:hypothetical protein
MHRVSALMQGIKVGIDLLRARRRRPEEPLEQEEELFI